MTSPTEKLLALIHGWMRAKKATQTALAEHMNLRQASLSMILSGKTKLPKRRLQQFINLLSPPAEEAREALLLFGAGDALAKFTEPDRKAAAGIEKIGRLADIDSRNFLADICSKGAALKLNLDDSLTFRLLEYWRDLPESKRFELLSKVAEMKEQEEE